jgi:hypothetical protein
MRFEAIWQLALARVRLARVPAGAILESLGSGAASLQATTGDVETAIGRAITSAAARVPWRSDCLLQAMAASAMLRKRNLASHVCIGVRRGPSGALEAHAWLVTKGGIVTGTLPDLTEFSVIPVEKFAGFNVTLRS